MVVFCHCCHKQTVKRLLVSWVTSDTSLSLKLKTSRGGVERSSVVPPTSMILGRSCFPLRCLLFLRLPGHCWSPIMAQK
jgi:hypothetical protein